MLYRVWVTRRKEGKRNGFADEDMTEPPEEGDKIEIECDGESVSAIVTKVATRVGNIVYADER